jgi:O-antigen/teichoic acid export membrane protein
MTIFNKINLGKIISHHFATIKNANTGKPDKDDFFTFLLFPIIISSTLIYFKIYLKSDATNIIISTLSIFVGLMFNIIVLIFDIIKRDASQKVKNVVLKELLSNISFAIFVSILSIIITLFTYSTNICVKIIFTWIAYFFLALFLVTLLMILKRMYNIFENEIDSLEKGQ